MYEGSWLQCPKSDQRISFFVNFPLSLRSPLSQQPATYFIQMSPTATAAQPAADANGDSPSSSSVLPSSQSLRLPLIPVSLITIPHAVPRETGFLEGLLGKLRCFERDKGKRAQNQETALLSSFFPWHHRQPPHPLLAASSGPPPTTH